MSTKSTRHGESFYYALTASVSKEKSKEPKCFLLIGIARLVGSENSSSRKQQQRTGRNHRPKRLSAFFPQLGATSPAHTSSQHPRLCHTQVCRNSRAYTRRTLTWTQSTCLPRTLQRSSTQRRTRPHQMVLPTKAVCWQQKRRYTLELPAHR